ncbi:cobalamin B12-binding domain-containing protein [Dialister sp.]|uniref:cobalamin B12-binding domain-containing protein n=1 Tax=Dialister sp. TaxID=1955814 RepID=UPI003F0515BF
MGLLWVDYGEEFQNLVDTSWQLQSSAEKDYFDRLPDRVKKIIYRDTRYNVDFLYTAYVLKEDRVMTDYARWLYRLMEGVVPKTLVNHKMEQYVIGHFAFMKKAALLTAGEDKKEELLRLLTLAQESVKQEAASRETEEKTSDYEGNIHSYLESLLDHDMRRCLFLVDQFMRENIPVDRIYVDILGESMRRVGELWHHGKISVAAEHYCTSVTQTAMSRMYPAIFSVPRKKKSILCACPGRELHDMGLRIVADVFENHGWDSCYLGEAVPPEYILQSIRETKPDLVALAVTMPQYLMDCRQLAEDIRKEFPHILIAVGGRAFTHTEAIWKKWPVNFYGSDALDLLQQVKE